MRQEETSDEEEERIRNILQDFTTEFMNRLIRRTPIDTGRARNGWKHGKIDFTYIEVYNEVPYVVYLEEGSSKQAPNGMLRITMEEIPQILQEAIDKNPQQEAIDKNP